MDGILVIDKPQGWTSHDVVAKVRRLTRIKRAGHTGTLDPMATGVLVVCAGQATRVVEYLTGHDKRYRATLRLGVDTDTYDAEGKVTSQRPVEVSEAALRQALATFVGALEQVPPMYSALKRGGQKLVDLARRGVEIERAPRRVTIHSLDLIAFHPPDAIVDAHCSAGTYVRSLAYDVGRQLGCGAHLAALKRTAAGAFSLDQAVTIERLEAAVVDGSWPALLHPIDAALQALPSIRLGHDDALRARHGMPVSMPATQMPAFGDASYQDTHTLEARLVRVYDPAGELIALARCHRAAKELRPEKVFSQPDKNGTRTNTGEN